MLRRYKGQPELIHGGSFSLDRKKSFTLFKESQSIVLSANEGKILLALLQNQPEIVSKSELNKLLWGTDEYIDENALQVNLTRLRKTLRQVGLENIVEKMCQGKAIG